MADCCYYRCRYSCCLCVAVAWKTAPSIKKRLNSGQKRLTGWMRCLGLADYRIETFDHGVHIRSIHCYSILRDVSIGVSTEWSNTLHKEPSFDYSAEVSSTTFPSTEH
ncbi:hypothetical protein V1477_000270 [Vespula maculifrons]|uniref:Uncharacterized protein n=2 Tax=Vespula TaxID=7451 RepID=A0A834JBL8_VESVU|nr:hypothetical protein HZH66_012038 [Vespula vulgaris]